MSWWRPRGGGLVAALLLLGTSCSPGGQSGSRAELADREHQQLRFALVGDPGTLDPALIGDSVEANIAANVFGGLYRVDDHLSEVADIAAGPPDVSADGLTYTFRLRSEATFSNADPVRARDFVYSWSRTVAKRGGGASLFSTIRGYDDVVTGRTGTMSGLVAVDDLTLRATLTTPSGWFKTVIAMFPAYVVDRKVIEAGGENDWWKTPEGLVGTGPFKMISRVPGRSFDFAPVSGYWRGATGTLTGVHIGIEPGLDAALHQYRAGAYDVLPADVARAIPPSELKQAGLLAERVLVPRATTEWVAFNLKSGPFSGIAEGKMGRQAFSLAIDRPALAKAVCQVAIYCRQATGGLVAQGLRGYLADDPSGRFDPIRARALLHQWDPDGSKVRDLKYTFESGPLLPRAKALQAQWKTNLGVNVQLEPVDLNTFVPVRNQGGYAMFRQGWLADYNHPQNWYDLFLSSSSTSTGGYANPAFDATVHRADSEPLDQALEDYTRAGNMLSDDSIYAPIVYGQQAYIAKPYVQGMGASLLFDHPWSEVRILRH